MLVSIYHMALRLLLKSHSWRRKEIKCETYNEFNKLNNTGAQILDSIYHRA